MPDDAPSLDLATIKALEEANLNGFPSERSVVDGAWVARLSPGNPARRGNEARWVKLTPSGHRAA